ncbi:gamma-glutamyltranspeptidase [Sinorhizobium meliloti]
MRSPCLKSLSITLIVALSTFAPRQGLAASPEPVKAEHGMVVTAQHLASDIGVEVLKKGGNAIDAAVAVGYALAVVYPTAGNIGGGGFMTIRFKDGKTTFLDFRERAPLAATKTMYLDDKGDLVEGLSTEGYLAVGVPGPVMGFEFARSRYGTKPLKELIDPAIELAREGFVLQQGDIESFDGETERLARDPAAAAIFLKPDGKPFAAGDRLVQTDLAASLSSIAEKGTDAFYKGAIADAIVKASADKGGILAKEDFERYQVRELEPVKCNYRGYDIVSSPPPSSGGLIICEILNILEGYPLSYLGYGSAETVHAMIEAMRHAYVDRNTALGDPAFVENPVAKLVDKSYAKEIRAKIDPFKAGVSQELMPAGFTESKETTHYSHHRRRGECGRGDLHAERLLRRGRRRARHGYSPQQRDGRFHRQAGNPQSLWTRAGRGECDRARQDAAFIDEPDDHLQGRQAVHGDRQPRRRPHHHHHAGSDHQRDRPRHEHSGGRRRAASPPSVASGQGLHGALCSFARYAQTAFRHGP